MIKATAELNFQLSQRNIDQLLRRVQSQMKGVDLRIDTAKASRDIDNLGRSLHKATGFAGQFGLAVGESARKFSAYALAAATISKLAGVFSSATAEVLKFDRDLVKLTQVTGKVGDQLDGITKHLLNLSVRTGISIGKLGELTTTLAQADLKGRDLANAIEVIAKSDLAPSFENMTDSVEGLIAIMQQFKRPSSELIKQFGYINNLSKQSAVESADLIEAVKRSGSVFESAGASLEEFAAMMAVVRSTTRESAETIATGLKTIVERIQRPEIIDQLRNLGVELENVEGKFVGPRIAFERLSDALRKRGSLEKGSFELINVAKEIGGGRQLSKLIPLLNSGTESARLMQRAMEGAATSIDDDAAIAMKSLSKQVDVLKSEFTKFFVEFSISDEFKEMAKGALAFANAMLEVLKATKPFIPLATNLAVAFGGARLFQGFSGSRTPRFKTANIDGAWDGGKVTGGSGAPGIDDVPKMLADGEFVVKTKSAMGVGYGTLAYINKTGKLPGGMYNGGPVGSVRSDVMGGLAGVGSLIAMQVAIQSLSKDASEFSKSAANLTKVVAGGVPIFFLMFKGFQQLNKSIALFDTLLQQQRAKSAFRQAKRESGIAGYERERQINLSNAGLPSTGFKSVTEAVSADPITQRIMKAGGDKDLAKFARRVFYDVAQKTGDFIYAQQEALSAAADEYEKRINQKEAKADARVEKAVQDNARAKTAFKGAGLNISKKDLATSRSELEAIRSKLASTPEVDIDSLREAHAADRKALNDAEERRERAKINSAEVKAGKHKASPFFEGQVRTEERLSKAELAKAKKIEQQSSRALIDGQMTNRSIAADRDVLKQVRREYAILKKLNDSNDELARAKTEQAIILGAETIELREATKLSAENKEAIGKHRDALNKSVASLGKTLSSQGFNHLSVAGLTSPRTGNANRAALLASSQSSIQALKQQSDDAFDRVTTGPKNLKRDESRFAAAQAARVALYAGPRGRGFRAKAIAAGRELSEATIAVNNSRRIVAQKQQDLDLIRANKTTMAVLQKRISSLKAVISSEEKLVKEQNKTSALLRREILAKANALKAGIIDRGKNFLSNLRNGPEEGFKSRIGRYGREAASFANKGSDLIGGLFAGAVAIAVAQLNALADAARANAEAAIQSGDAQTAYKETLLAEEYSAQSSGVMGGAAAGAGLGAAIGTFVLPAVGTVIGTAVGGALGGIVGSFNAVSDTFLGLLGRDTAAERLVKARDAARQANIQKVSAGVSKKLEEFSEQIGNGNVGNVAGNETLSKGIVEALQTLRTTDANGATITDNRDDLVSLYKTTADQLRTMGEEALKNGEGFEAVRKQAPELVKNFQELSDALAADTPNSTFTEQTKELSDAIDKEAEIRKQERVARAAALVELEQQLASQKAFNNVVKQINGRSLELIKASDGIRNMIDANSGNISQRTPKEFGVSLVDSNNFLSDEFNSTLDALSKLNPAIEQQATQYRDMLKALSVFEQKLPEVLSNVTPKDQIAAGSKEIKSAFGGFGEQLVQDFTDRFRKLIESQEGSSSSARERAKEIQSLFESFRQEAVGSTGSNLESLRTVTIPQELAALSERISAETDLRQQSIERMLEANSELENLTDSFNKTTFLDERRRRLARTDAFLKPVGESTTGNDVDDYRRLSALKASLVVQLNEISARKKNNELTNDEVTLQGNLIANINLLSKGLSNLVDVSAELSKAQEELTRLQDRQGKLRSKASELAFGGADVRNQFARVLTAQKFVSAGGNLQSLPAEIRGELYSFLQEFGDAKVFNGESGTEIINKQTANFLRSLGFSNEEAMSLITDMVPIEQRQLDELKKIVKNTAAANIPGFSMGGKVKGVDTIPAMVQPGEVIVSRDKARKNKGVLDKIQSGTLYAYTGGEVMPNGTLRKPKSTPLHESIKQMHQDNLQKMYARGEKIRSDADKIKKRKIRSFDPYESATNAMYDIMYQGRRFLEYTRESRDQSQVDSLSLMKTPSSSLDATDKFKNKYLPHFKDGNKFNAPYANAVNQYNGLTASVNDPLRLTPEIKEQLAKEKAKYRDRLVNDRTGLAARFAPGGAVEKYYETGKTWFEREKEKTPDGQRQASMMSSARASALADIAARKQAKAEGRDAYGVTAKNPMGTPRPAKSFTPASSALKKAKDQVESRLLQAGSKQLKFAASNEQIMTKEVLENMMHSLVNPSNLAQTRRAVGASNSKSDADFVEEFKSKTSFVSGQYGNVMSLLFGTGAGTNGNSLATSLFSKPVFKNGVFQSAVLNEQFLKDKAEQLNQIRPQLEELANFGSTSDIGKYVDKLSQRRFSKTMTNLKEALNQSLSSIKPQSELAVDPTTGKQYNPKTGQMPNGNFLASKMPKAQEYKGLYGSSSILDEPSVSAASAAEQEYANAVRALGTDGTTRAGRDRITAAEQSLPRPSQYKDDEEYRRAILANTAPSSVVDNRPAQQAALLQKLSKGLETLGTYTDNVYPAGGGLNLRPIGGPPLMESAIDPDESSESSAPYERQMAQFAAIEQRAKDNEALRRFNRARGAYSAGADRNRMYPRDGSNSVQAELRSLEAEQQAAIDELKKMGRWDDTTKMPKYHTGGIAGEMDIRVQEGEGIVQRKSMNKLGASTFNHINKTGELPMKEIQLNVDALMKTPPWMKDFQSSVAALAGTSIKAELAPVSVNVKINGAEVLASIQGQMKDLIKREVMTAVGNMYHDNSGKHLVRGM